MNKPTLPGNTQPGIWGGWRQMRSTYLHIEVESTNQELLQQLSNWMPEAIGILASDFGSGDVHVVTNKVRNKAKLVLDKEAEGSKPPSAESLLDEDDFEVLKEDS